MFISRVAFNAMTDELAQLKLERANQTYCPKCGLTSHHRRSFCTKCEERTNEHIHMYCGECSYSHTVFVRDYMFQPLQWPGSFQHSAFDAQQQAANTLCQYCGSRRGFLGLGL